MLGWREGKGGGGGGGHATCAPAPGWLPVLAVHRSARLEAAVVLLFLHDLFVCGVVASIRGGGEGESTVCVGGRCAGALPSLIDSCHPLTLARMCSAGRRSRGAGRGGGLGRSFKVIPIP